MRHMDGSIHTYNLEGQQLRAIRDMVRMADTEDRRTIIAGLIDDLLSTPCQACQEAASV